MSSGTEAHDPSVAYDATPPMKMRWERAGVLGVSPAKLSFAGEENEMSTSTTLPVSA